MIETAIIASALVLFLYGKGVNILAPTTAAPATVANPLAGGAYSSFTTAPTTPTVATPTVDSGSVFNYPHPIVGSSSVVPIKPTPIVQQAHPNSPAPVTSRAPGRIGASQVRFGTGSSAPGQSFLGMRNL